jgi:hypothetical protein
MPSLPAAFDWRKSPAHLDLLAKFEKPRDTLQVLNWPSLKETLKESPKEAIDRFVNDGALIPCTLADTVERAFTAADLKKLAKEHGLRQGGSKAELADRLVQAAPSAMRDLTRKLNVMKCSPQALALVQGFEQRRQEALATAQRASYDALRKGGLRAACAAFLAYQREYVDRASPSESCQTEAMQFILSSAPKVLGKITPGALADLRAACCMPVLWFREPAENWLPEGFATHLTSNARAVNYLTRNAAIRRDLAYHEQYAERVKIVFDEYDPDSCEACRKLNGSVLHPKDVPELPLQDCTSETGCKCRIESFYEGDGPSTGVSFRVQPVDEASTDEPAYDPVETLTQLRKMLDRGLITPEEYQAKKLDILSRM